MKIKWLKRKISQLQKSRKAMEDIFEAVFSEENAVMAESLENDTIHRITYGTCKTRILHLAAALSLQLADYPHGTVIGLYLDNRLEWIEMFWALLYCGHPPLLMNRHLPSETLEETLSNAEAVAVISDGPLFSLPTLEFQKVYQQHVAPVHPHFANRIIFMSSGTSHHVKLCIYDGECLFRQVENSVYILHRNREIVRGEHGRMKVLLFLPLYHVFGFLASYLWYAFIGGTFVFLNEAEKANLAEAVRRHQITHIFAVPLLWNTLEAKVKKRIESKGEAEKKRFDRLLLLTNRLGKGGDRLAKKIFSPIRKCLFGESVRFMITGGSDISPETISFFNGIGYRLVNGYGMTEAGIASVALSKNRRVINSGTIGLPFPSVSYCLKEGELFLKGPSLAKEIREGKNVFYPENQWLPTGDLAFRDRKGWHLQGRKDDLIVNSRGENISPFSVENQICISGCTCALIGLHPQGKGTRSLLLLSTEKGTDIKALQKEVISQLSAKGLYRMVDSIGITCDSLWKENEIKLNRKRLSHDIEAGNIRLAGKNPSADSKKATTARKEKISRIFEAVLGCPLDATQYDANFFYELGGSSLGYFQLTEEIKKEFGANILSETGRVLYSVNDIDTYLSETDGKNTEGCDNHGVQP